ncbi:WecB/TagA/CpsF family glycosyltransferase [Cohnella rhizosphaerae]|uniref:N-acetylglucosaminyldiphosphoundecaprenol N-acetyl-beta-D-mannosaminyltransferase n=1 Tax=Cohnella rhizosphaerae TaxID=1457232 RepID=A0A9X4L1G3_9BACL|nr:WecB/TagA/CpsF family glycosyltransferase [Cohnella rhizosphaerae]MDG0811792.1 WecB/TagA/CpsF family glycosyltransferase [Cohnella rhizosphaerae]
MSQSAEARSFPTVSIYGIPFSKMNMVQTVDYLVKAVASGKSHRVVTGNPEMVMKSLQNPVFRKALATAELVVPDGTGVVWAARRVRQPVAERVAGYDLLHELMREGGRRHWSVYLLGASQDVVDAARAKLASLYPGIRFAGVRNGYFTDRDDEAVVSAIREAKPDLLFVARSMDNQEPWLAKHQAALGVPVMMGVGGSFDVLAGKTKRAPAVFIKLRLEWFYRLLREPTRIRRMMVLPRFAIKVARDGDNLLQTK